MIGGEGGIRTHGTLAGTPHFECGAVNRLATSPLGVPNALRGADLIAFEAVLLPSAFDSLGGKRSRVPP